MLIDGLRGQLVIVVLIVVVHIYPLLCQKDTLSQFSLPACGVTTTKLVKKRFRIAFISHDSAIATFFHNPEQGSRDAANIIDVDIEWNHYLSITPAKMAKDIHDAVDSDIDGIIVSIPNDEVYDAVKYALNKAVPVIVFNAGLDYATSLGLTRVLQNDIEAGIELGQELSKRNYSRPLVVQIASFDQRASDRRIIGLQKSLGAVPDILKISERRNNTVTPEQHVRETFLSKQQQYDSVISIGGAACADIVASAMLGTKRNYPDRKFAAGFFDIGGDAMTSLFRLHTDTIAISQLPYYQTALPVFYMYLRLMTGEDVYANQTIKTGPNLVTNTTFSAVLQNEQNTLLSINDKSGTIGALIADTRGDTYSAALMAGMTSLAQKLNWTIYNQQEDGILHKPNVFEDNLYAYLNMSNLKGLIVQTSDQYLLDLATRSVKNTTVGMVTIGSFFEKLNSTYSGISNMALDIVSLAKSVAKTVASDGKQRPVCMIETMASKVSPFCSYFYEAYQEMFGNAASANITQVVQYINLSYPGVMESEFMTILNTLHDQGYEPDSFIAFSEYVFTTINNIILKGYIKNPSVDIYAAGELFDQNQAYLEGRVKHLWTTNMFSMGFMSLLHIALDQMVHFPSWENALISTPRIEKICEPGKYHSNFTTSAYCQDNDGSTQKSIQCLQCPENMYTDSPNQDQCKPCAEGYYALPGSSTCTSCYETAGANRTTCAAFLQSKQESLRTLYMAIFIPIGIILFLVLVFLVYRYLRRRFIKQRELGNDETWLLSLNELLKPPMSRLESHQKYKMSRSKQISNFLQRKNSDKLSAQPSAIMITDDWPSIEGDHIVTQTSIIHTPELATENSEEGSSGVNKLNGDKALLSSIPPSNSSKPPFVRLVGYHCNLPVFIQQIGFKKVRVDDLVRKEVLSMKNTRHPNLIEFVGLILENQRTFVVEEFCSKGSLADVLANSDIELAWIFRFSLVNDLVNGMRFLHRSKFSCHGLLTSDCCMVTGRWELKISNYGFKDIRNMQTLGSNDILTLKRNQALVEDSIPRIVNSPDTLLWLAPETVSILEPSGHYITHSNKAADVYSAGIIINEILTREKPYARELKGTSPALVFQQVCNNGLRPRMQPPKQDGYTDGMNSIVFDCLHPNPTLRPSFKTIGSRVELLDPYFCCSDSMVDNMALLLEKYANDMENLVKTRTANLQQRTLELEEERARTETLLKDLKTAKEVAEAAAASKQNFLANMSHEIRTPMNAVIGMSRSLMESDLPPDLFECAEIIESSGNHLMALIDDILDFSKIESGSLKIERSMLDLTYVIESATKLISSNFLSKGLVLWYTIDPELPVHVFGDIVRLRQILLNLLSNAFKFTSAGYVSVSVTKYNESDIKAPENNPQTPVIAGGQEPHSPTTQHQADPDAIVSYLFAVKDTGKGIPANKTHKLFKSFSQVDASTTRNYGGTGLGLAISQKLCRLMGGDMWVESEEGKGATFYFKINLEKQNESKTFREEYHLDYLSQKSPKILIILENKYIKLKWESVLNSLNMPNYEFKNPQETRDFVLIHKSSKSPLFDFSLIIIDTDFSIINDKAAMSSYSVLELLQKECPLVNSIPTLCVIDSRLRKDNNKLSSSTSRHEPSIVEHPQGCHDPAPTPAVETPDPLDQPPPQTFSIEMAFIENANKQLHAHIVKPFKNTRLIGILHNLLGESLSSTAKSRMSIGSLNSLTSRSMKLSASTKDDRLMEESNTPKRTLVVDDNQINIKVLSKMLSQMKISVEVANNGREAFEMVSKALSDDKPFDLIFMDIWMPEMNGFEASEKIRKEASSSDVEPYIVALTACVMPGDREKCVDAGMNGYVSKPIRKEELEASIHTFSQTVSQA